MTIIEKVNPLITNIIDIFNRKTQDYSTSWRILRMISITEQIYIKGIRIYTINKTGEQRVVGKGNNISDEFMGIINYSFMALVQNILGSSDKHIVSIDENAVKEYYSSVENFREYLKNCNPYFLNDLFTSEINILIEVILIWVNKLKNVVIYNKHNKTVVDEFLFKISLASLIGLLKTMPQE